MVESVTGCFPTLKGYALPTTYPPFQEPIFAGVERRNRRVSVSSTPAGVAAISQGLSAATPLVAIGRPTHVPRPRQGSQPGSAGTPAGVRVRGAGADVFLRGVANQG